MEHNSPALPSLEEKTISMALAIAAETDSSAAEVFREAGQQLRAAKATLDGSVDLLADAESSEEAEADCNVDLMVAQMMSSRALSNLWSATEPLNEALGFEEDEENGEEEPE